MGRKKILQLFSITNPATAAELAASLNKAEYNLSLPENERYLDILTIVKCLLQGTIEYVALTDYSA
jgi:hypothetical protein